MRLLSHGFFVKGFTVTIIAVDWASEIDLQEAEGLGIKPVPMQVRIGDEDYLDGTSF